MTMTDTMADYLNSKNLPALEEGLQAGATSPVMATPAVVVAALAGKKVVAAAAGGAAGIAGAYTVGRAVN